MKAAICALILLVMIGNALCQMAGLFSLGWALILQMALFGYAMIWLLRRA